MMKQVLPQGGVWLDAGCGEGWYAEGICQALSDADNPVFCFGVDISKDALKYAAKRQVPSMRLAVGSVYHMPVLDHSCDAVLNVFAPLVPDVYQRILKRGGHLLLAVPHTTHLWGLKEVLYDTPYPNPVSDTHLDGFALIEEQMVQSRITLTKKEDIQSLFVMTPYAYRTGERGRQRLLALDHLETEISFKVLLYQLAF
ncbi:MAG: methyltransferase domain-containing protein [Clostridia bacterium]|nr:methyltransferase domain-containing protein [Clostridia bacterium]